MVLPSSREDSEFVHRLKKIKVDPLFQPGEFFNTEVKMYSKKSV